MTTPTVQEILDSIADCVKIRDRQRKMAAECRADGLHLAALEHDRKADQEDAMADYFHRKLKAMRDERVARLGY